MTPSTFAIVRGGAELCLRGQAPIMSPGPHSWGGHRKGLAEASADQKEPCQKRSSCSRALLSSLLQGSGSPPPTCQKSAPGSPHLSLPHQVPGTWVPLNSDHLGLTPAPPVPTSQLQKLQASL